MARSSTRWTAQLPWAPLTIAMSCVAAVMSVAGCTDRHLPVPSAVTVSTVSAGRARGPADASFGVPATAETLDRRTFQLEETIEGQLNTLSLTFTVEGDLNVLSDCGHHRSHYQLTEDHLSLNAIPDGLNVACSTAASTQLDSLLSALTMKPALRLNANMLAIMTNTATFRLLEQDPETNPGNPSR